MSSIKERVEMSKEPKLCKGQATIQLFDENGNLVHEQKKHNYVHPKMLEVLGEVSNYIPFQTSQDSQDRSSNNYVTNNIYDEIVVRGIMLTSNAKPTNPTTERYVEGTPIGFASNGVTGGSALRGTYNNLESVHRNDYHKWVFDFATSEANGTFQSIYMGKFDAYNKTVLPQTKNNVVSTVTYSDKDRYALYDIKYHDGYLYFRYGVNTSSKPQGYLVRRVSLKNFSAYYKDTDGGYINTDSNTESYDYSDILPSQIQSFCIANDRMYFLCYYKSSPSYFVPIYSAPLSDLTNVRLEKELTTKDFANVGGFTNSSASVINGFNTGMTYRPDKGTFLLGYGSSYGAGFYEFNNKFEVIEAHDTARTVSFNTFTYISKHQPNLLISKDYIYDVNTLEKVQYFDYYTNGYFIELGSKYSIWMSNGNAYSTYQMHLVPSPQFFSRVLLDSPVEKTSRNTMKIIYEYTHEPMDITL